MKRKINTLLASDYKRYSSTREMPKFQKWMRKYQETDNRILKIIYRIIFVILRKREGLIQTVWEEGKADMELSEIREGDYIRVTGQIKDEERAPHGKEVRLSTICHLSHVSCP